MADLSIAIEILGKDSFSPVAKGITGTLGGLFDGAAKLGMGVFGIGQLAQGVGSLASGMISGNAQMETYQTQLETLMGSADGAKERIAQLAKIGADTPFELPQLVQSEKILMGFGLTTDKTMKLTGKSLDQFRTSIGDMAAGTGTDLGELTNLWGKFGSGATGEAISRLQELGIVTREQLTAVGVEFSKSGELTSPLPKAMEAAMKIADSKFGGGMAKLSGTFEGQMSTLADSFNQAKTMIMAPIFDVLKGGLTSVNALLSSDAFKNGLSAFASMLAGGVKTGIEFATNAFNQLGQVLGGLVGLSLDDYAMGWDTFAGVLTRVGDIMAPFVQTLQDAWETIQQVFAGDWEASDSIDPVVNAVGQLAGVFQQVSFLAEAFVDSVGQALGGDLPGALGNMTDALDEILPNITSALGGWAKAFVDWIGPMIPPMLQELVKIDLAIADWIYTVALPTIVENLGQWVGAFLDWVGPLIPPLLVELGGMLVQIGSWLLNTALPSLIGNLAKWALAFVEWVAPRIPPLLLELGKLGLALGEWITGTAMPAIVAKLVEWGAAFVDWIGTEVLPKLPGALAGILDSISEWATNSLNSVAASMATLGQEIVDGIGDGIAGAWGDLTSFFGGKLRELFPFAQGVIEAGSPSRLAARMVGQPIAQGIAQGMIQGGGAVNDAMAIIINTAIRHGIDPLIALALAKAESTFNPAAVGDSGASVGLFQLHERGQGAGMGASRLDPAINAEKFLGAHKALFDQLVAEGLAGEDLARTFGRLAEGSDPQFANRYAEAYRQLKIDMAGQDWQQKSMIVSTQQLGAAQKQGTDWAKVFADQQARLSEVLRGQVDPDLIHAADAAKNFGAVLGPIERQVAGGSISMETLRFKLVDLARATGLATTPWDDYNKGLIDIDEAMMQVVTMAGAAGPQFEALRQSLGTTNTITNQGTLDFLQLALGIAKVPEAAAAATGAVVPLAGQTQTATDRVGSLASQFGDLKPVIDAAKDSLRDYTNYLFELVPTRQQEQVKAWDSVRSSINSAADALREYRSQLGSGGGEGGIPSFAGGGYMPYDGLAFLHKGERVSRPGESFSGGSGGGGGDTYIFEAGSIVIPGFLGTVQQAAEALESAFARKVGNNGRLAFQN